MTKWILIDRSGLTFVWWTARERPSYDIEKAASAYWRRSLTITQGVDMAKLTRHHIETEWHDIDGYWIELKPGFKSAGDPLGVLHTIHEDTKCMAYQTNVLRCNCKRCIT